MTWYLIGISFWSVTLLLYQDICREKIAKCNEGMSIDMPSGIYKFRFYFVVPPINPGSGKSLLRAIRLLLYGGWS